jgi:hypothetical protein
VVEISRIVDPEGIKFAWDGNLYVCVSAKNVRKGVASSDNTPGVGFPDLLEGYYAVQNI